MSVVSSIRRKYPFVTDCNEQGCKLGLTGLNQKNSVILKGEEVRVSSNDPVCDRIVFKENSSFMLGIVELKSKNPKASKIIDQINGGLELTFSIIEKSGFNNLNPSVILIVLAKSINGKFERDKLRKPIKFKGKKIFIVLENCGDSFTRICEGKKDYIVQIPF